MKKLEDLQRSGSASVEQDKIGRWVEYRLPEQKHLCAMMHAPRDTASIAVECAGPKQLTRHGIDPVSQSVSINH